MFHQRQDKVYLFAEYFHRFGKWSATAGMGVQYTDFLFKESGRGNHSWSPRPQATVTYALNQNHNFRLNFTSWQSIPVCVDLRYGLRTQMSSSDSPLSISERIAARTASTASCCELTL